jgi:hypothetical protein
MLEQIGNPFGILHIRFSPWYGLDRLGIAQQEFHLSLQHVADRLPIHTRRLQSHRLALLGFEPLP